VVAANAAAVVVAVSECVDRGPLSLARCGDCQVTLIMGAHHWRQCWCRYLVLLEVQQHASRTPTAPQTSCTWICRASYSIAATPLTASACCVSVVPRSIASPLQEVCNLLYGYGHLRQCSPELLEGVAKACSPRLHEFSTQDLCLSIWSYGMVQFCPAGEARGLGSGYMLRHVSGVQDILCSCCNSHSSRSSVGWCRNALQMRGEARDVDVSCFV
jgi:hypothetical protein